VSHVHEQASAPPSSGVDTAMADDADEDAQLQMALLMSMSENVDEGRVGAAMPGQEASAMNEVWRRPML
jgi:hypothetical protein